MNQRSMLQQRLCSLGDSSQSPVLMNEASTPDVVMKCFRIYGLYSYNQKSASASSYTAPREVWTIEVDFKINHALEPT